MKQSFSVGNKEDKILEAVIHDTKEREIAIRNGMFAYVSWRWVRPLVQWIGKRKVLEVMAGRGWLSAALRQCGVDVIATDDFSWSKKSRFVLWKNPVTEVRKMDAVAAVRTFGSDYDVCVMSWPFMDNTAYRVLKEASLVNPDMIVLFIGEGCGGCTADNDFFDHFQEIDDERFERVQNHYESWYGIHDCPTIGRYFE
jgi:hypothetical protein